MRWRSCSAVVVLCLAVGVSRTSEAAPVLIANAGFELPVLADGGFTAEVIPDWIVESPAGSRAGVFNPPASEIIPSEGENLAYLGPFGETASPISQTLATLLQPSTIYTLQVDVGRARIRHQSVRAAGWDDVDRDAPVRVARGSRRSRWALGDPPLQRGSVRPDELRQRSPGRDVCAARTHGARPARRWHHWRAHPPQTP